MNHKIFTFKEALADSEKNCKNRNGNVIRHLLLGNGFSIAYEPTIFTYNSLFSKANFASHPEVPAVFDALNTQDFEEVAYSLEQAAKVTPCYDGTFDTTKLVNHADAVKKVLINTIASNHPENPDSLFSFNYTACSNFLNHFIGSKGKIYTLNYDILLYWVLMHGQNENIFTFDDGFRSPQDDWDADYVTWDGGILASLCIYYLHGALHLFDSRHELQKFTWKRTDIPLLEQARTAINKGAFPLFVAEGTSEQKMAKIQHSAYLHRAYRSLSSISGCVFIHGLSLSENDKHILRVLERGKMHHLYIGIFGDPNSETNQATINRALQMENARRYQDLNVHFYDTASADVWGKNG